jgi:hypothetical protein
MKTTFSFNLLLTLLLALGTLFTSTLPAADNPFEQAALQGYTGLFRSPTVKLRLQSQADGLAGTLEFNGQAYTAKGQIVEGRLEGTYTQGGDPWPFTLVREAAGISFTAGKYQTTLQKAVLPKLAGTYRGNTVVMQITPKDDGGYGGTVKLNDNDLPFTGKEQEGELTGLCVAGESRVTFTVGLEDGRLMFRSGRTFAEALRAAEEPGTRNSGRSIPAAFENSLGMKFVKVPDTEALFCIWETRVQDYEAFVTATGYKWEKAWFEQGPTHPAVNVSWDDAKLFCTWLTKTERKAGRIESDQLYRLPTDAEWSLAVGLTGEAGSTPQEKDEKIKDVYPWGTTWPPPSGAGNFADMTSKLKHPEYTVIEGYDDDFAETSPVGSFKANALGLYDLSGNVWEWCEDWYNAEQKYRVLRGASWFSYGSRTLLSSSRGNGAPDARDLNVGFRCVLVGGASSAR